MTCLSEVAISSGILVALYFMCCLHAGQSVPLVIDPAKNLAGALGSRPENVVTNVVEKAVNWTAIFATGPGGDIKHVDNNDLTRQARGVGLRFEKYPVYKWPNGVIPYWIEWRQFDSWEIAEIEGAIAQFNIRVGCLKIRLWQLGDDDYVNIVKAYGCWSYLGRIGGGQNLSLGNGCLSQGTILHEFMHAAGFAHEHNRFDRDEHVKVLWDNISKDWQSQYQKVNDDFKDLGKYDYYSVMHYPVWSPSYPHNDAFQFPPSLLNPIKKQLVGAGETLSAGDVAAINKVYGC